LKGLKRINFKGFTALIKRHTGKIRKGGESYAFLRMVPILWSLSIFLPRLVHGRTWKRIQMVVEINRASILGTDLLSILVLNLKERR